MAKIALKLMVLLGVSCFSFQSLADEKFSWNPCPDASSSADADDKVANNPPSWNLLLSPYTHHWRYNPDHKHVFLAALEKRLPHDRFCGAAFFSNSFGQPSTYVYAGKQWDGVLDQHKLFTKVSVGLIYGYKGPYQHKIPFNDYGVAPAIIPSLGWHFTPQESAQVMVLGTAGLLFAYGRRF
jgi:hypothetical protein